MSLGPGPDVDGNMTVGPTCVSCGGTGAATSRSTFDLYGGPPQILGFPLPCCVPPGGGLDDACGCSCGDGTAGPTTTLTDPG